MSKGKIINHLGGAQYTVEIEREDGVAAQRETRLTTDRDYIVETYLPELEAQLTPLVAEETEATETLQTAIESLKFCQSLLNGPSCSSQKNAVDAAVKDRLKKSLSVNIKRSEIAEAKAQKLKLDKEIEELQSRPPQFENITAWCSDACGAPDQATYDQGWGWVIPNDTEVSIADCWSNNGGSDSKYYVIWPNDQDQAGYDASRDGLENSVYSMTPEQAGFSNALFPGVETWRPLYRAATVSAMVDDTHADVTLEETDDKGAKDGPQTVIDLNDQIGATLSNVEIDYMGCELPPMDTGDKVLVWFQNRDISSPLIIGFITNPKPLPLFTVDYFAEPGLTLTGDTNQTVAYGRNATSVTANGDFLYWDNPFESTATVQTLNVKSDISRTAYAGTPDLTAPDNLYFDVYNVFGAVGSPGLARVNPGYGQVGSRRNTVGMDESYTDTFDNPGYLLAEGNLYPPYSRFGLQLGANLYEFYIAIFTTGFLYRDGSANTFNSSNYNMSFSYREVDNGRIVISGSASGSSSGSGSAIARLGIDMDNDDENRLEIMNQTWSGSVNGLRYYSGSTNASHKYAKANISGNLYWINTGETIYQSGRTWTYWNMVGSGSVSYTPISFNEAMEFIGLNMGGFTITHKTTGETAVYSASLLPPWGLVATKISP